MLFLSMLLSLLFLTLTIIVMIARIIIVSLIDVTNIPSEFLENLEEMSLLHYTAIYVA